MLFPVFILVILFGVFLVGLVVAVLISDRRRPSRPRSVVPPPPPRIQREERLSILTRLADRRITVEEAEQRLLDLGDPVPSAIPPPPPPAAHSGGGSGCGTAAVIVFAACIALLLLLMIMWFVRFQRMDVHHSSMMRSPAVQIDSRTSFPDTGPAVIRREEAEIIDDEDPDWQEVEYPTPLEQP